jgi:hypothetical protein
MLSQPKPRSPSGPGAVRVVQSPIGMAGMSVLTIFESYDWSCEALMDNMLCFCAQPAVSISPPIDETDWPSATIKQEAKRVLAVMVKAGAYGSTDKSWSMPTVSDDSDLAVAVKTLMEKRLISSDKPQEYQVTSLCVARFKTQYRLSLPAKVYAVRADVHPTSMTTLELLMHLNDQGWSHACVPATSKPLVLIFVG